MYGVCVRHCDFCKLPRSNLTNMNILCLGWFGSGGNKLVQLLIRERKIYDQTVRTLINTTLPVTLDHLLPSKFNYILIVPLFHFPVFAMCG